MVTQSSKTEPKSDFEYEFKQAYLEDWDVHRKVVQNFDALEAMVIGQVFDSVSNSVDGSKITDSYTTTLAIERAARVMGKLPEGQTQAAAKADQGTAAFFDILRQKWIYPNANAQFPFELKLEMWQFYSDVYGYMPMFRDWNVATDGYVGPDCWLWNPRNLVFQQGRTSFHDMEYVTALTWVSEKFLQDIIDDQTEADDGDENKENVGGWNYAALQELKDRAKSEQTNPDIQKDTQVTRTRVPQATRKGICLATRYEVGDDGEWVTFAPDHGYAEVRRLPNPHKDGRIPFTLKYSQELFDSVYGLGDFQRAKPLQFARDGLTNFYFKGIKMNLIPPIVVNANGVLKHTIDYREGGVMMETVPNSIRRLETSSAGLATYQAAQTSLTGSLLTVFGSQNASAPGAETLNPSQGKTPAAIDMYADKEASRDGRARKRLELAIEELTDGFFAMIANIGTEDIPVQLFAKDIEEIAKQPGLADVLGLFTTKFEPNQTLTAGQLTIDPKKLKNVECRFFIERNSTAAVNQQQQLAQLENLMGNLAKFQNEFKDNPAIEVNWGKLMTVYAELTNLPGADEFVTIKSPQQVQAEQAQMAQQQQNSTVTLPNGQVHEVADLSKIYVAPTTPDDVKNQILPAIGLQASQMPSPAATTQALQHSQIIAAHNQGQLARDQAQTQALQAAQPAPEPAAPGPTFAGGAAYHDPLLAKAADHVSKLGV